MSRRGYARRPGGAGTDANGMTPEDRAAARTYRMNRFGGGLLSKRFQQDLSDITSGARKPDTDKNK